MDLDLGLALGGLVVGFVVGLTGMGGGALMTPILVLVFDVQALVAVSSDVVASMVMKPVGGAVHLRRGTVNTKLVRWLALGSVPAAFAGVLLIRALGSGAALQERIKFALGLALLLAVAAIVGKAFLAIRRSSGPRPTQSVHDVGVRPVPTVLIGVAGGLVVGMTSVGSGSLMIVLLLMLYPTLRTAQLVGTDLVQAVPLVASASIGHLLFGNFELTLTTSLLLGALPGVYVGARVSAHAPERLVRRALALVLLASGLKLVDLGNAELAVVMAVAVTVGPLLWRLVHATDGLRARPALARHH